MTQPTLKRSLTLIPLVMYGLGTTIGAGIYALVGELAERAGLLAACAFFLAAILAALTAFSYAELSGRFPQAAGAALYVEQGFRRRGLSRTVGLLVIGAGAVSSAALINGFAQQLQPYLALPHNVLVVVTALCLAALAFWGIVESVTVASLITLLELGGLIAVIWASHHTLWLLPQQGAQLLPATAADWQVIFAGGLLAFYAFIGFEDMVDVAEEVQEVRHTLPWAIVITLTITTVLYLLIMISALLAIPVDQLATDPAPLVTLFQLHTGYPPQILAVISLLAIINGALIQMIMISRVLYGLGCREQLPRCFATIHPRTQTPTTATLTAAGTILLLALIGGLSTLAIATSVMMLSVFTLVNLALWRIKGRTPGSGHSLNLPRWWPLLAALCSGFFLGHELLSLLF